MLSLARYLLGVVELSALVGFATLGARSLRYRLLPGWAGAPAHLATAVLALALLIWVAELLGTLGLFKPLPYVFCVIALGLGLLTLDRGWRRGGVISAARRLRSRRLEESGALGPAGEATRRARRTPHPDDRTRGRAVDAATLIAFAIAAAAVVHFATGVRLRLSTGMTGFDSTWYHGPFAAGFFQSGDTFDLHFIAPQFLAWFYPANSELFHAIGMAAFDRDIVSPLLNLGWFVGCLVAAWCIGRPFGVAPLSLALGAVALNVSALADQAGEARNDIVGIFFLLAAVAFAVNAWNARADRDRGLSIGALVVVGLAAGLAAGTKLNFLLPAAALVIGMVVIAPKSRWRVLAAAGLPALAGGGYWYLRNLVHTGNPLPWVRQLGPIDLPAPAQGLGGRDAHSVWTYLTDGSIWADWFLPGLHGGFGFAWPLLIGLALAGLVLCLGRGVSPLLRVVGVTGLAVAAAWLIAPTSASGPPGMPRGFESGLRYLAPALVLGLALLPVAAPLRDPIRGWLARGPRWQPSGPFRALALLAGLLALAAIAVGYPVQRHYLESRYADPGFTAPGLNAAFKWSRSISAARMATTSTRQYPLFGTDLSNRVDYIGTERPHGGFTPPTTCRAWRRLLNAGRYDYVIASRDRTEAGKPTYPPAANWTSDPNATLILSQPPTKVFRLTGFLDPTSCR